MVPESPRWFLVNDRMEEAVDVLVRIAKGNGKLRVCTKEKMQLKILEDVNSTSRYCDLFRSFYLAKITIIGVITW